LHHAAARIALRAGDLDEAATEAAGTEDIELRTEVASALLPGPGGGAAASALLQPLLVGRGGLPVRALLVAGAAAAAEGAWEAAAEAYRGALAGGAAGAERVAASAGLARASRALGAPAEAVLTLGGLAADEPLAARVARVLAGGGVSDGR
jgi:hypothetical protein